MYCLTISSVYNGNLTYGLIETYDGDTGRVCCAVCVLRGLAMAWHTAPWIQTLLVVGVRVKGSRGREAARGRDTHQDISDICVNLALFLESLLQIVEDKGGTHVIEKRQITDHAVQPAPLRAGRGGGGGVVHMPCIVWCRVRTQGVRSGGAVGGLLAGH